MNDQTRQHEIDENLDFFRNELPKLSASHLGKFAVIRHREIVAFFDTALDAVQAGRQHFDDGLFSIQQVITTPINLGYYSYAMHLGSA